MASASKNKGKRFERQVADFLTETFQVGKFLRTQGSGAFTGGANAHRLKIIGNSTARLLKGDIIPPDNINLVVECKNHTSFSTGFAGIMDGENKKLNEWLNEVLFDSNFNEAPNFLVFKITDNSGKMFFALPTDHFDMEKFRGYPYTVYQNYEPHSDSDLEFVEYLIVGSWVVQELRDYILEIITDREVKK